jgi:hypothetical protein
MAITDFYDLEARKIRADGEKVALFTGHPTALGSFREARLRQYISEHVPARYEVTSGFITSHDPNSENIHDLSSRQIDCLIHEPGEYAPLLKSTDFAVVVPQAVAAVVEVKSELTLYKQRCSDAEKGCWKDEKGAYKWSGTLVDALENIKSAIGVLDAARVSRDRYFAGVIGYAGKSMGQFVAAMTSGELWEQLNIQTVDQMPCSICIFGGPWFWISGFPWVADPEKEGMGDSDSSGSYVIEGAATEGGSLQMFTAVVNHTLTVSRHGQEQVVGGLRSGKGYRGEIKNHPISLPSPRQHAR